MLLNLEQIKAILPHRDPFLLIDQINEIIPSKKAVGQKYISKDEFYFKGHFPNHPVMPGVLILETMAQVGAVALLSEPKFSGKIAFFAGVEKAKFRKQVRPGDTLVVECELVKLRSVFGVGEAKAYVDGNLVCEATLSFAIGSADEN